MTIFWNTGIIDQKALRKISLSKDMRKKAFEKSNTNASWTQNQ